MDSHNFQLCSYTVQCHISRRFVNILGAAHLLTMTKSLGGICPIVLRAALYLTHKPCFMPLIL
jgi:hypothetical protein